MSLVDYDENSDDEDEEETEETTEEREEDIGETQNSEDNPAPKRQRIGNE